MSAVVGSPIIFWIIRIIVLVTFIVTGWWISNKYKRGHSFWKEVLPLVIIYSLAEGLRWERGIDYHHYYHDLTSHYLWTEYSDVIYLFWVSVFKFSGFPFWVAFVFYSLILIVSFLYLIQKFPQTASFALPLFLIITSSQSENFIRQYFSIAFIILGMAFLFEKRYKWMIVLFLVSIGIHFSAVVFVIFFTLSYFITKVYAPQKPLILVLIYIVVYLFWDNSYFSYISELISQFLPETGTVADNYVNKADIWFSAEGSLSLKNTGKLWAGYSMSYQLSRFFTYLFLIIGGYIGTKNNKNLRYCFWLSYIAIILDVIKGDIENYIRFFHWVAFVIPIVVGSVFSNLRLSRIYQIILLGLIFVYYGYMQFFGLIFAVAPAGYAFIWD